MDFGHSPNWKRCHGCWCAVEKQNLVGGLYCSAECQAQHEAAKASIAQELTQAGFEQSSDAPNVFSKDGVALTIDEVKRNGMVQSLDTHRVIAASLGGKL